MEKKYIDNISKAWQEVLEKKNLDPVDKHALKGKHADRKDKDIDNDGDVDSSDEYLHKRRKAVSKAIQQDESSCGSDRKKYKTEEDDMETDEKPAKDGMKKCAECGGSSDNHDEECSHYESSEKKKAVQTKESIRHEEFGYGEIITETENGYDILFAHGVEFDVPAEQCEGVSYGVKTAKKMGGNMTGAIKKIEKSKKGLSDNPRVKKALRKANEDDDPCWDSHKQVGMKKKGGKMVPNCVPKESVQEGTVAELDQEVQDIYQQTNTALKGMFKRMWESSVQAGKKAKEGGSDKPADDQDDNLKGKGAEDMGKDLDAQGIDKTKVPKGGDDEVGHDDASKAGRAVKSQSPTRGDEKRIGDKNIINPVKKG